MTYALTNKAGSKLPQVSHASSFWYILFPNPYPFAPPLSV
jgi:hypothetical protein